MRKADRINHMNAYCMETLANLYNSDAMQGILNYYEARQARFAGVYNMKNVMYTESLDLNVITFKTKKAKADFFKSLFQLCEI
jgi:hypothetical protein